MKAFMMHLTKYVVNINLTHCIYFSANLNIYSIIKSTVLEHVLLILVCKLIVLSAVFIMNLSKLFLTLIFMFILLHIFGLG